MKKLYIIIAISMIATLASAEDMIVYPKGVTDKQIQKHGRARTRAMIHIRTRSLIKLKLNKKQKEELTAVAMGLKKHTKFVSSLSSPKKSNLRKHNWSTSKREKKYNKKGILK